MKTDLEQYDFSHRTDGNNRFLKEIAAVFVGIIFLIIVLFMAAH
jgi:hypothetical protein